MTRSCRTRMATPPSRGRIRTFRPAVASPSNAGARESAQDWPGPAVAWPAKRPLTAGEWKYLVIGLIALSAGGIAVAFSGAPTVGGQPIAFIGFVFAFLLFSFILLFLGESRNPHSGGRCPACHQESALKLVGSKRADEQVFDDAASAGLKVPLYLWRRGTRADLERYRCKACGRTWVYLRWDSD